MWPKTDALDRYLGKHRSPDALALDVSDGSKQRRRIAMRGTCIVHALPGKLLVAATVTTLTGSCLGPSTDSRLSLSSAPAQRNTGWETSGAQIEQVVRAWEAVLQYNPAARLENFKVMYEPREAGGYITFYKPYPIIVDPVANTVSISKASEMYGVLISGMTLTLDYTGQ